MIKMEYSIYALSTITQASANENIRELYCKLVAIFGISLVAPLALCISVMEQCNL
jgi:hypothetical protein